MAKKQKNRLSGLTVEEISLVDKGAGEGVDVKLIKRIGDATPAEAYAELQRMAAKEASRMAKSSHSAERLTEEQCFARYFDSRDPTIKSLLALAKGHVVGARKTTPLDTVRDRVGTGPDCDGDDDEFAEYMEKAAAAAKRDPTKTQAQHFSCMWEVRKRAKPPANSSKTDDDDVMADDSGSDDFDDDDSPTLGPPRGPRGGAGSKSSGRSSGVYETSGVNTMTNARQASVGSFEGSYSPSKRPSSVSPPAVTRGASSTVTALKPPNTDPPSLRKSARRISAGPTDEQLKKRALRYVELKTIGRSTNEGITYMHAPKRVRKAMEERWVEEAVQRERTRR
jgi:hypothetical protein